MKAAGEWDFQPTPPPFDPVAFFCAPHDIVPMPGAFEAHLDFSKPPDAMFENGPLFGCIPEVTEEVLSQELPGAGVFQPMGLDGVDVSSCVFSVAHAAAAVQLAAAHEGLGFGVSRLSPLIGTPVRLPHIISSYVETLGEFSGPDERRWLFNDFLSEVDAVIRSAHQLDIGVDLELVRSKVWLPVRVDDGRLSAIVAHRLEVYFQDRGFSIPAIELIGTVFSGDVPPTVAAIAQQLPPGELKPLRQLFLTYSSDREFLRRFTSPEGSRAIGLLGLEWDSPSVADLGFQIPKIATAINIIERWSTLWKTFEMALGTTFKVVSYRGSGDPWQAIRCVERPGGVTITSHYTLDSRGASYRACFGTPVIWSSVPMRMTAVGRINPRPLQVSIVRDHFGLN